jgi:hypothetical protein
MTHLSRGLVNQPYGSKKIIVMVLFILLRRKGVFQRLSLSA